MRTILLILWSVEILINVEKKRLLQLKIFTRFKKKYVIVLMNDPFLNQLVKYEGPRNDSER